MSVRIPALLALLMAVPAFAAVTPASGFAEAAAKSAELRQPLVVLVHGAAWQRASRDFMNLVWSAEEFRSAIGADVVACDVSVPQNPDENGKKNFDVKHKGWDRKSLRTFPAVQVYAPDGHLLRSLSGRQLLETAARPADLAAELGAIAAASAGRDRLLAEMDAKDAPKERIIRAIDELNQLELNPEPKAAEKFRRLDPEDVNGWADRLAFGGWDFIRRIHGRIGKKETDAALAEVEAMLARPGYTPRQRALILGAKGMLLAAKGETEKARGAYRDAHRADPDGPEGKAMLLHGRRTVDKDSK